MVGGRWGVAADHDPFLALYSAFDHFQTICVTNHLCQTRRVQPSVSATICVRHEGCCCVGQHSDETVRSSGGPGPRREVTRTI